MSASETEDFTPSEELVMEVLVARWRLGERLWTFSSRQRKAIQSLAAKGYVNIINGNVVRTVRASLTEKAIAENLTYNYIPPVADTKKLKKKFKKITKEAKSLKRKLRKVSKTDK